MSHQPHPGPACPHPDCPGRPGKATRLTTLTITRGLPASGKTTWARQQPGVRVNRDDLRAMLLPTWPWGDRAAEDMCTAVQHAAIVELLIAGRDVIVDDTNLHADHVEELAGIAAGTGCEFRVRDFTDVPVEVCVARDAARPSPVGEAVIRRMHERYLAAGSEQTR